MGKGPFKMKSAAHGGPMRRNFPSAFKDTGDHEHPHAGATDSTTTPPVTEPHWNYGSVNKEGTKIMDKQGNWVSLKHGTEGVAIRDAAAKSGHYTAKEEEGGTFVNVD